MPPPKALQLTPNSRAQSIRGIFLAACALAMQKRRFVIFLIGTFTTVVVLLYLSRQAWWLLPANSRLAITQAPLSRWLNPEYLGANRPARHLLLCNPMGLALNSDGELLISDRGRGRRGRVVWRIDASGVARIVAGSGRIGDASERAAREMTFDRPEALAVAEDGAIFLSDGFNHAVFRIAPDGVVDRVAGTGKPGFSGDGGIGSNAQLDRPADLRMDRSGNLFIADVHNHRVRMLDSDGRITTVAGTGEKGFSPDGTEATEARLDSPWGLGLDREDRLLIGDSGNHRVRRVNHDGRLVTLAGNGTQGYAGDGGHALEASLNFPEALIMDQRGRLFIGDEWNNAVRVVDTDGLISTVIGVGFPGRAQIGGVARISPVDDPEIILLTSDGLIIADGNNGRVIRVDNDGIVRLVAGRSETAPCFPP
jgi:sugar lactone lactonase YvrE